MKIAFMNYLKPIGTWGLMFVTGMALLSGCQFKSAGNLVKEPDYWPTEGWKTTIPEKQGMDSGKIAEMYEKIDMYGYEFHHILVIRNGYVVSEANYYPYKKGAPHNVFSITKSVTSALTGIAVDQGLIKSERDLVSKYLPDFATGPSKEAKGKVSVAHLLTMSSGLKWNENGDYSSGTESNSLMWKSENQLAYVKALPIEGEPGETFQYSTGSSHLLGEVVSKAVGKELESYANEKLWGPLGIKGVFWGKDNQGFNVGGSRSLYTAEDLAKLGLLYLNKGKWENQQVISADWINKSTSLHIQTPSGPAAYDGYGYQWWMNAFGGYSGRGYAGQFLYVLQEQNMVVVMMGSLQGGNFFKPDALVKDYLIPACVDVKEIPENADGIKRIAAMTEKVSHAPSPEAPQDVPVAALKWNGKIFDLENNEKVGIEFTENSDVAQLHWLTDGVQYDVPVGLDNIYRFSDCKDFYLRGRVSEVGFKGKWLSDSDLQIDVRPLESDCNYLLTLTFNEDGIVTDFKSN